MSSASNSSSAVVIDIEHVARRTVQLMLTACIQTKSAPSSIWILYNSADPANVSLPLSPALLKLPIRFVYLPAGITRAKDSAVYLGGYLSAVDPALLDNIVLASSRCTCFTSEVLGCKQLTTIRNAEELSAFGTSIGVDIPVPPPRVVVESSPTDTATPAAAAAALPAVEGDAGSAAPAKKQRKK